MTAGVHEFVVGGEVCSHLSLGGTHYMIHHTEPDNTAETPFEPETGAYTFVHNWKTDGPLWIQIVDALDSIPEIDTPESPFLFEAVDPEALDELFAPASDGRSRSAGMVVVPIADTLVTVWADGTVQIRQPEETHVN
jgi:hypothetical protein